VVFEQGAPRSPLPVPRADRATDPPAARGEGSAPALEAASAPDAVEISPVASPDRASGEAAPRAGRATAGEAVTVVTSGSGTSSGTGIASVGAYEPEKAQSDLAAEVALLDEARRLLGDGQAGAALAALSRYRTEVPRPRLDPEARYLELEALVASGAAARARRAATVLIEQYPGGPHAARARRVLEEIE
jgi:hypothetical protein